MRVTPFAILAIVVIGCGGVVAPAHGSASNDAGSVDAGADDVQDRADGSAFSDGSTIPDGPMNDASVDAQVPSWCGYQPDFSSVTSGCENGCLVALRRSGEAAVLANANDGTLGSGAVLLAGDDAHLWVESQATSGDNALLAYPSGGGAPFRVASWSTQDLIASIASKSGVLYFARDGKNDAGNTEESSFFQWTIDTAAQATLFGPMLSAPSPPPWDLPSIVIDGDFAYAIRHTAGVDRIALQNGNALTHVVDGPLLDAQIADGAVFVVRSGGTLERAPLTGGSSIVIATLPSYSGFSLDVDRASHMLIVLGSACVANCTMPDSALFQVAEDGSTITPLTPLSFRVEGLSVEGSRAYFYDECLKVPEGSIRGPRYFDRASGELHWVGDEPGFPFVPHALGVRSLIGSATWRLVGTSTSIYGFVVGD